MRSPNFENRGAITNSLAYQKDISLLRPGTLSGTLADIDQKPLTTHLIIASICHFGNVKLICATSVVSAMDFPEQFYW